MEAIRRNTLATLMAASLCPLACATPSPATRMQDAAEHTGTLLARLELPDQDALVGALALPEADRFNRLLEELRQVALAGQPGFTSVSKQLLGEAMQRQFPALPADTDVEKVYVTTFHEVAGGRREITASRSLVEVYREIILHPGTFPVFNQSETAFFNAAGTLASATRIPGLSGGSGLVKVEAALRTARDFRPHFQRRVDRYWDETLPAQKTTGEVEAPTRKAWLARTLATLRQSEVNSMVDEGWLDHVGAIVLGARAGVTGIEVLDGNFRNKLSLPPSVALSERSCASFPQGDCGKILLLSTGLPTRLFESAEALRAWLIEAGGEGAMLRTQAVSGDPWRWLLDRVVAWGVADAFAAMTMLETSTMAVADASATIDRHGDLTGELDQRQVVDTYNARLRLDLLMPDAVADGTREAKAAWRAQVQAHFAELRRSGALLAGRPDVLQALLLQARAAMTDALQARGVSVTDPDAISIFHWTWRQHHMGGKPRRWRDEEGVWHKVDDKLTWHTGRKVTLTEMALENLPAAPGPLTHYDVVDADKQPISDLSYATVATMVREANVAQRYLDAIGRFEGSLNLDAFALGLGHGMMLNLLHDVALTGSHLTAGAQASILHALANPGIETRIAVHRLQVNGASIGGGVLLFHAARDGNDAYVLYTPGAPDGKAFRGFRALNDIARKLKDDEALRNYVVEAIVAGERAGASRILIRGGRGGEVSSVPITGDFLIATARAFFAQLRNESQHLSTTTSFRDRLTVADNVAGVMDTFSMVLPLSALVQGGLDMNDAVECFLGGEEKGCYGKLAAAGLAIAMDALPFAARPLVAPVRSIGRAVRRFASVTRGPDGKHTVRFALPTAASSPLPGPGITGTLRQFEVSGLDVTTMHSPSRQLFRDGTGQEYVRIGDKVYRSRVNSKPDGSSERVIVDPGNAGNTRTIKFSRDEWSVLPAPRLLGGSPRQPPLIWGQPRWGEGYLKGIDPTAMGHRIHVDIEDYQTDILFDLGACKWRAGDGAMRPGAYVEYSEITRRWQYAVPEPGRAGAPPLPPPRASQAERLDALRQFGIDRAPVSWPRSPEGARTQIPKVINQVWLGDAHALTTRRTGGDTGNLLVDTINANGLLAKQEGYKSRLYVLLDDEAPAALQSLRKALPNVEVLDLQSDALFKDFRTTKYVEAFEFFRSGKRSQRNLAAASDILRNYIQYKNGGLYLDTDDALREGFGRISLKARADEVLTGPVTSHRALGMTAEYNTNAFASQKENGFFIEVLDEQALRFKLNHPHLDGRPYDNGGRDGYEALVPYMHRISQTTGPGVFNDTLRRHSRGHADFADAIRDSVDLGGNPWLGNIASLDEPAQRTIAEDAFAPLRKAIVPGNSHSWRQTR
jgi:hypothetical protein